MHRPMHGVIKSGISKAVYPNSRVTASPNSLTPTPENGRSVLVISAMASHNRDRLPCWVSNLFDLCLGELSRNVKTPATSHQ